MRTASKYAEPNALNISVRRHRAKVSFGEVSPPWENVVKMDIIKVRCETVNWIELT
jgi:hypothetical protein